MDSVKTFKNDVLTQPLILGKQGENGVTRLRFEFPLIGENIDALTLVFRIAFLFSNASDAGVGFISPELLPQGTTTKFIEYVVESACLTVAGEGKMEVLGVNVDNETVWKSNTIPFTVLPEVAITDETLPELPEWIVQLTTLQAALEGSTDALDSLVADVEGRLARDEFTGASGEGISAGGEPGQVLTKRSNADFDTTWVDNSPVLNVNSVGNSTLNRVPDATDKFTVIDGDVGTGAINEAAIAPNAVSNLKFLRTGSNKVSIVYDDLHPGAVGDSKFLRTGDNKIAILGTDISDTNLNNLSAGSIDLDAVSLEGDDGKFDIDGHGITVKDNSDLKRVRLGKIDDSGVAYGMEVYATDGTTVLFGETGITKDGIPQACIDMTKFDNTVVDIFNTLNKIFFKSVEPTEESTGGTFHVGDIWYQTDVGETIIGIYNWNGEAWIVSPMSGTVIAAQTITAAQIVAHTITALQLAVNTITAASGVIHDIDAGVIKTGVFEVGTAAHERTEMYTDSNGMPCFDMYDHDIMRSKFDYSGLTFFDANGVSFIRIATTTANLTMHVGAGQTYTTYAAARAKIPYMVNHSLIIEIHAGTYNEDITLPPVTGMGSITIRKHVGDGTVTFNNLTILNSMVGTLDVSGFTLAMTGQIKMTNLFDCSLHDVIVNSNTGLPPITLHRYFGSIDHVTITSGRNYGYIYDSKVTITNITYGSALNFLVSAFYLYSSIITAHDTSVDFSGGSDYRYNTLIIGPAGASPSGGGPLYVTSPANIGTYGLPLIATGAGGSFDVVSATIEPSTMVSSDNKTGSGNKFVTGGRFNAPGYECLNNETNHGAMWDANGDLVDSGAIFGSGSLTLEGGTPVIKLTETDANTNDWEIFANNGILYVRTGATSDTFDVYALTIDNAGKLTLLDGGNIAVGTGTGTMFGTAITQKIGFYGKTPIVQRAAAAQAAAPAGGTGVAAGAYDTAAHRDSLIALVNEMRTVLVNLGLMKGSA